MCNPKPRQSRRNLEGRCISFLKFRLSHGRQDAETHDTTQVQRRGAARFASTRVSCGMNRPTSWRIAAMVAHKAATRRPIAWVAVTIAGGDRCHGISNAARRDPQTRWKSRRLRALCTHRRRNRGQNPARSPHRRNPVLDANLQSPRSSPPQNSTACSMPVPTAGARCINTFAYHLMVISK